MEINYSKKQINPLVEKYHINVETNVVFQSLIVLFNEQPNYQVWAIKAVFEGIATVDDIKNIQQWAIENPTEIKNLVKGNIVSYKTKTDFSKLFNEMNGLNQIKFVSDMINQFNTTQKKMLKDAILGSISNGYEAFNSPRFQKHFEMFKGVSTLPKHRQEKMISLASAINDSVTFLIEHINNALTETYTWEKNDMLGYMARNCKDCSVVYDKDNIVVATIRSFDSSKKLCGGGRTGWCLTRQESYFNNYTRDNDHAEQFFIFNFNKREDHQLAHIGVSVNPKRGITHAHTTRNDNLMSKLKIDDMNINIHDTINLLGIPKNIFVHFRQNTEYEWTIDSFLKMIEKSKELMSLSYSGGNRFIINVHNKNGLKKLVGHSFINVDNFAFNSSNKFYLMLDFNLNESDDKSIVLLSYAKDTYKIDTLRSVYTGYNVDITKDHYLQSIGIETDMYLNREDVDPKILLHKYIDEQNEKAAIELLKKHGTNLDVNFEFNSRVPIFSIIENNMLNLFGEVINMPNFDSSIKDFSFETLFQSLLYKYISDFEHDKNNLNNVKSMIQMIIKSNNYDINVVDYNDDTAMHITCEYPQLQWVFEELVSNPTANPNIVNDFNCTPLGTAIKSKNITAINMLLARKDVVVREEDYELANSVGIDLKSLTNNRSNPTNIKTTDVDYSFAEIIERALRS